MSLYNTFADAGDGIVVSFGKRTRKYRVGDATDYQDFEETNINETREWVALTYAAARAQCELNVQPTEAGASYHWSMQERVRPVKSYSVTREYEYQLTTVLGTTPAPTMNVPSFSPAGRTSMTDAYDAQTSLNVTITNNTAASTLHYRVAYQLNPYSPTVGQPWPFDRFKIHNWKYSGSFADGFATTTNSTQVVALALETDSLLGRVRFSSSTGPAEPPLRIYTVARIEAFSRITRQNPVRAFDSTTLTRMFVISPVYS